MTEMIYRENLDLKTKPHFRFIDQENSLKTKQEMGDRMNHLIRRLEKIQEVYPVGHQDRERLQNEILQEISRLGSVTANVPNDWLWDNMGQLPEQLVLMPDRPEKLESLSQESCQPCWDRLMRPSLLELIIKYTTQMERQVMKIEELVKAGELKELDMEVLRKLMNKVLGHFEKQAQFLKTQGENLSRSQWNEQLNSLVDGMIMMTNELMLRHRQTLSQVRDW